MARRDKAGPGPRVRPEQAALQGARARRPGLARKNRPGALRDKVSQSPNSGKRAGRNRPPRPSSAWKSAGKSWRRQRASWQSRSPQKSPAPSKRAGGALGGSVHGFVHGKIYEVEQENVGTEGAHHSELLGESAFRQGSRFVGRRIREHPARAVRRAEARYGKAAADYQFYTRPGHPELSKNALSRYWQKRRLRKQYQKAGKGGRPPGGRGR